MEREEDQVSNAGREPESWVPEEHVITECYPVFPTAPGQARTLPLAIWGYSRGGQLASTEPVTVRATAYFTGPSGAFVRLFSEYFTQQ